MMLYYTIYIARGKENKETEEGSMKTIAVMSPKGGIGKTTTADSIAYILGEEQGKRVLILDGDPQGDTSKTFGCHETAETGMSRLLECHACTGGECHTSELIWATAYPHIDMIPANGYLVRTDLNLMISQEGNQVTRLKEALAEVEGEYDYCICDCGRLFDMAVVNILVASELVIAPIKVGGYENEAIKSLCEQVEDLRQINPDLRVKGILTMRQKNKTSLEFEEYLHTASGIEMFKAPVRRSIMAEKATIAMAAVPAFAKRGIVAQDYRDVVKELLEEMEG